MIQRQAVTFVIFILSCSLVKIIQSDIDRIGIKACVSCHKLMDILTFLLRGIRGIVFTHGVRMGGRLVGQAGGGR